jgi:hypothetical protein
MFTKCPFKQFGSQSFTAVEAATIDKNFVYTLLVSYSILIITKRKRRRRFFPLSCHIDKHKENKCKAKMEVIFSLAAVTVLLIYIYIY